MSNNFQEYVAYLDTHNAEPKPDGNINPTNNVILPCQFPNRMTVAQISLGSLEMPLAQYNIEANWNTFQFDEGIDLYVLAPEDEGIVQFVIQENGVEYVAQLPPRLNPIVSISTLGPTNTAVFTTQYPHCLELRGFFNWGEAMKLIDTPLNTTTTPLGVNQLTESNADLVILSDTQFQLTWTGAPVTFVPNASNVLGYVSTPSIPSPVYLAELVTLAMDQVIPGHWKITYDSCTGKYKLCWVGSFCDVRDVAPAILIALGNNSLPHIMGFGCANVPIPLPETDATPSIIDKPRELPSVTSNCIQSIDCSPCRSQIELDIGNYTPDGLMSNLSRQLNRFYFDPGCNYTASPYVLYYSNQCGTCSTLTIPFGMYSPDSLATFLTANMTIPGISVTWNINTGQFQFSATDDFGLEFDANLTTNNVELAYRLGFYPISYRNNNIYTSITPFYLPTKGCCGTSIPDRHLSYVYTPLPQSMLNNQKRFMIEISKTRSIQTVGPVVDNGDGTLTITTAVNVPPLTNIAHGFQVLDVVEITIPSAGNATYELTVTRVDAYNQFTVDLGSIPASVFSPLPGPAIDLCLRLSNAITTNVYFSCLPNDVLALTLGFNACDYLWEPSNPTTWIAPAMYCLDFPNYVLVEITQPVGATHNMHAWNTAPNRTDTLTSILAKVILYPQFRMERSFPFVMKVPDLKVINRIQIRILNPNHTEYLFHGRQWSLTLLFAAVEKSINQLCY